MSNAPALLREYNELCGSELDLELLLRGTLEYLWKNGPANIAILLPTGLDREYTLGGYINYTVDLASADFLLQQLTTVLAPNIAQCDSAIHTTNNVKLAKWMEGGDVGYLADNHLLAFPCRHNKEPLAVFVLFRPCSQPFNMGMRCMCDSLGPFLGQLLSRIIRVHHRLVWEN